MNTVQKFSAPRSDRRSASYLADIQTKLSVEADSSCLERYLGNPGLEGAEAAVGEEDEPEGHDLLLSALLGQHCKKHTYHLNRLNLEISKQNEDHLQTRPVNQIGSVPLSVMLSTLNVR